MQMGGKIFSVRTPVMAVMAVLMVASLNVPGVAAEATTTAGRVRHPEMGVQFHAMWGDYTDAQRREVLDKLAAAGVKWVRVDVGWASVQESKGEINQWHMDLLDSVVDGARSRGIKVLATLWRTPEWANNGAGLLAPPARNASYGNIAEIMARRFRGRISAWEVWNEPNLDDFFTGDARDYAGLLKASYKRFKAGDPNAKVVMGGPSYNDTEWLERVYKAGAAGSFDIMSTHPYQGVADAPPDHPGEDNKWWLTHTPAVRRLMKKYGDGNKKIWFTELGWSSHKNSPGMENWMLGVTPRKQGEYLVRMLKFVGRKYPYVTNVFWYNERNRDSGNIQVDNYGLLRRNLDPKPAYRAMKRFLTS